MSSNEARLRRRENAIALRRTGKSRGQIKAILGIGNSTLDQALKGVPPPTWTRQGWVSRAVACADASS